MRFQTQSARPVLLGVIVSIFTLFSTAPALAITNANIDEQRLVVMERIIDTLHEQVKLVQMVLIKKLEGRVAELRAQIEAGSK